MIKRKIREGPKRQIGFTSKDIKALDKTRKIHYIYSVFDPRLRSISFLQRNSIRATLITYRTIKFIRNMYVATWLYCVRKPEVAAAMILFILAS